MSQKSDEISMVSNLVHFSMINRCLSLKLLDLLKKMTGKSMIKPFCGANLDTSAEGRSGEICGSIFWYVCAYTHYSQNSKKKLLRHDAEHTALWIITFLIGCHWRQMYFPRKFNTTWPVTSNNRSKFLSFEKCISRSKFSSFELHLVDRSFCLPNCISRSKFLSFELH